LRQELRLRLASLTIVRFSIAAEAAEKWQRLRLQLASLTAVHFSIAAEAAEKWQRRIKLLRSLYLKNTFRSKSFH